MAMADQGIRVGTKAPAFTLANQDDKKVSLKDLQGQWVVLYFYPKDDTPGCTTEACEFTASLAQFANLSAKVVGVSPDPPESHRKFIAKHKLKIELLSDPERKVLEKYGAWGEKNMYGKKTMGVIRSTVLIDPEGRVAHHWPKVKAQGHAQAVNEKLTKLQAS
jgi:peroxiredoxin Q/BCP